MQSSPFPKCSNFFLSLLIPHSIFLPSSFPVFIVVLHSLTPDSLDLTPSVPYLISVSSSRGVATSSSFICLTPSPSRPHAVTRHEIWNLFSFVFFWYYFGINLYYLCFYGLFSILGFVFFDFRVCSLFWFRVCFWY